VWQRWLMVAAGLSLSACAAPQAAEPAPDFASLVGPGTRSPQSELERALLPRLGDEPDGTEVTAAGQQVNLGPVYAAASGRQCRVVRAPSGAVAACQIEGAWAFVPDVVTVERGAP